MRALTLVPGSSHSERAGLLLFALVATTLALSVPTKAGFDRSRRPASTYNPFATCYIPPGYSEQSWRHHLGPVSRCCPRR